MFTLLATGLLTAGLILFCLLQRDHPLFFKEYYKLLIAAIAILSVPLLLRVILDVLNDFNTPLKKWIESSIDHTATYNLLFFLFTTYSLVLS